MHATDVIRRPLVTEKATIDSEENNRYAFEVDRRATKDMIRKAVQDLYKVRVESVATQNRKGETRRLRYGRVTSAAVKRAIVKLHSEDRIELI
ncbi:MAG: 50S ribosomal protein L23 [Phycisphaeraceae bacterium]|jgi:large subunit ribosomal protein L23|nr:50S ribosomal protein L23 [Phycisphaeraceae bacterium]MDG1361425.1 50S ribosomal protein L23 [Phycisphaerales bacterium]MCP4067353.1 50S ribosomal protein L23 [Phycisphaeraceae bacterium]MCP4496297.1 50S ribosomal protein L23 [Phycisphaeraceae bacterium]MCP4796756.1 50S ribosomal protein L23 [Phycisphaeraceae bacterium]